MRESRTYGSVRGARDETRVPTATRTFCCDWVKTTRLTKADMAQILTSDPQGLEDELKNKELPADRGHSSSEALLQETD